MRIGRTTLLLFLMPVLLLAVLSAALNFLSLHSLKLQRDRTSAVQAEDVMLLTEAARLSQEMAVIQTRVSVALDGAAKGRLDEAQLYRIHAEVVNKLAALLKRVDVLSHAKSVQNMSPEDARVLPVHFSGYRDYVVMATDIAAIDPTTAKLHIDAAQQQFIAFSEHAYQLSALLAERTKHGNEDATQAFEGFFNQVMLFSLVGMAVMLLLSLFSARMLNRKIITVAEALGILSGSTADKAEQVAVPLPDIERMRVKGGSDFRAMAGAVLAFRDALVERARAAQNLRASEEQLRIALEAVEASNASLEEKVRERTRELSQQAQMIEQVSDAILLTDPAGLVIECNSGAAKMFGYAQDELKGMAMQQFHLAEEWGEISQSVLGALAQKDMVEFTTRYVRKSGEVINAHVLLRQLRDEDGQPDRVLAYIVDITARVAMEERLTLSQQIAHYGLWDWNIQTNELLWTDEIYRIFGLQPQQFAASYPAFVERIHPDDREAVGSAVQASVESDRPYEIEHRIVRPDGSVRDVLEKGQVYRDAGGKPIRMVGVVHDITERRAIQKQLELFRQMIETSNDPVYLMDADDECRLTYVNEAAVRHWKVPRETLLTWRLADWNPTFTVDQIPGLIAYARNNPGSLIETEHRVGDGTLVPVSVSANLLELDHKTYLFGYFQDVTERRRIEHELAQAKEQAEAANEAKSEFLANMSHEIRTPMNSIIGFSHLCLQTRLEEQQRDYLQKVNQSANSLLGVINDILDFSKIESGKLDVEKVPFQLGEVLAGVAAIVSIRAEEKGLEFLIDKGLEIPETLIGDSLRLGQVLNNLANNAVKFTDAGEVEIRVELVAKTGQQATLRFTVSDTGIGMTEEQMGRLFQSFSQADASTSRKYGGTGLGLAIAKRLVELMGGRIWLESAPGQGSRFMFEIPFVCVAAQQRTANVMGERKVLVVDDNASARRLAQTYLKSFGVAVVAVSGWPEAEAALRRAEAEQQPFSDVLLDWNMQQASGLEVARCIKQESALQQPPRVIYLSGNTQRDALKDALSAKLLDVVVNKPITASRLYDALMTVRAGQGSLIERMPAANTDFDLKGLHVLLVEDNEFNQQLASALLNRARVRVSIAGDGVEALQALQQDTFDAVLMDMQMPNMDGLEATRRIRDNPAYAALPIIAMTANAMFGDRERCLNAGMNDYISKPINYEMMYATLGRWTHRDALQSRSEAIPEEAMPGIISKNAPETMPGNMPAAAHPALDPVRAMAGMGGEEIYLAVLEKFIPNQGQAVESLRGAIDAGDMKLAERLAHTLKGIAATVGAATLSESARQLEAALHARDEALYAPLLASAAAEMHRVVAEVRVYLHAHQVAEEPPSSAAFDAAQLTALRDQLGRQLQAFDAGAGDTMRQLRQLVRGNALEQRFAQLERYIKVYDYENAQAELRRIAGEQE